MIVALALAMIRSGALTIDDISEAARIAAETDADAAHLLNCIIVKAQSPDAPDWLANRARKRFRIIDRDGGNSHP